MYASVCAHGSLLLMFRGEMGPRIIFPPRRLLFGERGVVSSVGIKKEIPLERLPEGGYWRTGNCPGDP